MKKVYILTWLVFLFYHSAKAQSEFIWRGFGDVWSNAAAWENLFTGDPGVPADGDIVYFFDDGNGVGDCVIDGDISGITFFIDASYAGSTISNPDGFMVEGPSIEMCGGRFDGSGGGTFIFDNVTIGSGTVVSGTEGDLDLGDAAVATFGSLTLDGDGLFHGGSAQITINGNFVISGGTFTSTSGNLILANSSNILMQFSGGTFNAGSGTVILDVSGGNKQISSSLSFNNLTVRNTATSATNNIIIPGTTTVLGTLALSVSQANSAIAMTGNGTMNVTGNVNFSGYASAQIPNHNYTINFNGSSGVSTLTGVSGLPSQARGKMPSIAVNQTGTASLTLANNIAVAGNWTYNGTSTVNAGTSTVTFFGAGRTIGGTGVMTFNNLGIGIGVTPATVTLASDVNINGALNIISGSTFNTTGRDITVNGATTLTGTLTASNNTLSFGANFAAAAAATLNPGNAVFRLIGTGDRNIDFFGASTATLHTLHCAKTSGIATITAAVNISNLLTCTGGTLNTNGQLTLLSTAANSVAQVGNSTGGTYSGAASIQRFIPAKSTRRWHFLAAPVLSGQIISNSWQQQMFITGPGTGPGPVGTANFNSNGFDWTAAGAHSMFTYNENQNMDFNSRWVGLPNTSVALATGTGYRVFVRGGRSTAGRLDGSVNTQDAVTLVAVGTIPGGNQDVSISCSNGCVAGADGWNFIGNPYPATIDWNLFHATNSTLINGTYYVYDPDANAYQSWNGTVGSAGRYISSGQAFWVEKSASGTTTVQFQENHKTVTEAGTALFKRGGEPSNLLKIKLSGTGFGNETFVHLNSSGQYGMDKFDAYKLSFANYQVATFDPTNTTRLDINNLPEFGTKTIDTIELDVKVPLPAANYVLDFNNVSSFANALSVVLEDKLNNTFTDLKAIATYNFATNGNANSAGNRFRVLISNNSSALPVDLINLQAQLINDKVIDLTWSTLSETNNARFVVEHSLDGKLFGQIGTVNGSGNSSVLKQYTFKHNQYNKKGLNYYRLKQVDFNGECSYSNVCFVSGSDRVSDLYDNNDVTSGQLPVLLYPVPAQNRLNVAGVSGFEASVTVYDIYGGKVAENVVSVDEGKASLDVSSLTPGVYIVEITNDLGKTEKVKFVKE